MVKTQNDFRTRKQEEVDRNYSEFEKLLAENAIPRSKFGTHALMRDGKILGYYTTWEDAKQAGSLAYEDGMFSIQEVTRKAVNLGFFSAFP